METHLKENTLLEEKQSAYRKYHSTETALLDVTSSLFDQADGGQVSVLTLLDLSAALDTLDHSILLRRLETTFGICGMALKWFDSYIKRLQSVVINGLPSKPVLLHYGVPQGSVLGPILFTLYTQPVSHVMCKHNCSFHKFADGTQLRKSALPCDFKLLTYSLECCIKEVKQWMTCNKLKLNDDKTEAMTVGTHFRSGVFL